MRSTIAHFVRWASKSCAFRRPCLIIREKTVRLLFIIFIALLGSYTYAQNFEYAHRMQATHKISMQELLGNLKWYDGEPVEIIGVASFKFVFESASGIYASKADLDNGTYAWVVVDFPDESKIPKEKLVALNGKYIGIQGVYHDYGRESLKDSVNRSAQIITMCTGICGAAGYIAIQYIWEK